MRARLFFLLMNESNLVEYVTERLNLNGEGLVFVLPVDLLYTVCMNIEKNIPMPDGAESRTSYPFIRMAVGDSFLILDATWIRNLRSAAYMHSRRHPGVKFTCRRYGEGWRLWRVS